MLIKQYMKKLTLITYSVSKKEQEKIYHLLLKNGLEDFIEYFAPKFKTS